MKKYSKLVAIILIVIIILPGITQAAPVAKKLKEVEIKRLGGVDRIATSVFASQEAYEKSEAVVLTGFGGDIDALTGTLLAGDKKAPVLITRKQELTEEVKIEIERLGAKTIYILGGENAVHPEVERELSKIKAVSVKRIAGLNRNDTAAKVAKEVKATSAEHIFLAIGRMADESDALADALAIGPVSAMKSSPVLLTNKDSLPKETKQAIKDLKVKNITIVGGTSAVSEKIEKELAKDYKVDRVGKESREKTAVEIAERYFEESSSLIVAYGRNSADALVGGYLGNNLNAPVLLTNKFGLTPKTREYITFNTKFTYILGGEKVVNKDTFQEIERALIEGGKLQLETASLAAEMAIANLPSVEEIKISDKEAVADAKLLLEAVKKIDPEEEVKGEGLIAELEAKLLELESIAVSNISLNKESIILIVDQVENLVATVEPSNATNKDINWESSNENVAKVTDGRVEAKSEGIAYITASAGRKTTSCLVVVNKELIKVEEIILNKTSNTLMIGQTDILIPTVLPIEAANKEVMWTSLDENIANVDNTGKVTAVGDGVTRIIGKTVDGNKTAKYTITVKSDYDYLELNKAYIGKNHMTVTVKSIEKKEEIGSVKYTVFYNLKNETTDKEIDEASFKMHFEDGTNLPQYGFFGSLFPGESIDRSYSFEILNTKVPTLIEYEADFFSTEPSLDTLIWKVE